MHCIRCMMLRKQALSKMPVVNFYRDVTRYISAQTTRFNLTAGVWSLEQHPFDGQRRQYATQQETIMNVFDRKAKRIQKNRTAMREDFKVYDYLRDEVGWRTADRIFDIKRQFGVALELGCWRGHVGRHILGDSVQLLYQCDMAEHVLAQSTASPEVRTMRVQVDEEYLPFRDNSLDLVVSSLSLHWVNDLPGTFKQINRALRNDGCFLGSMFGGDTLFELRVSLQLAEEELEGGFAAHISPFTSVQDLGNLLTRAGYTMLTIDVDELIIRYPGLHELMYDLKGMGENNASWSRKSHLRRSTQKAAEKIYRERYGDDESIPATFQIINFIGWKPDSSQRGPAKRGSGQVSLKDIGNLDGLNAKLDALRTKVRENPGSPVDQAAMADISRDLDELRRNAEQAEDKDKDENKPDDKNS